jgi:uncharacterized protein (PEP-CTERM system associated)
MRAVLRRSGELLIIVFLSEFPITASADDWVFTPRITGQEMFTDNVLLTPTDKRFDVVTTLSPGINISDDSERLRGTLDYAPTLYYYAFTPGQSNIGHNLYANGTATVIPDFAYFDIRGFAALQPTTPSLANPSLIANPSVVGTNTSVIGTGFNNLSSGIPINQLTQSLSLSASPYLVRRFGDFGTAELRYTYSDTTLTGVAPTILQPLGTPAQNTATRTSEGTATFVTGREFGPYEGRLLLDAAESNGTGTVNAGNQAIASLDSAYALTRRIAPLVTIGHEQIQFNGLPPVRINDLIWGFGVRLTPSQDATITLRYGHADGITSPNIAASFNITPRTTITIRYSESLSSIAQLIANNLAVSDLDQDQQVIDSRTLLPLSIVNPILGVQTGLFDNKQFTGTADLTLPRDHVAVSLNQSDNLVVAQTTPGSSASQQTIAANIAWSHDITVNTATNIGMGYSHSTFAAPANSVQDLVTPSASISYTFTQSLKGSAGYSFLDRFSPQPASRLSSNIFFVSLRKDF